MIETISFISQMAKLFERANTKRIKTKGIRIMPGWLFMFMGNEYNYCTWNSIRSIEGSNKRGSDKRGSD